MGLFHHKKDEDILKELEKDIAPKAALPKTPAPPAPPGAPKPPHPASAPPAPHPPHPGAPAIKMEQPALRTEEVANLPLFMKVQEYDNIVKELGKLTETTNSMHATLNKMVEIKKAEKTTIDEWRNHLQDTKKHVKLLVSQMPETGRLKDILNVQKKQDRKEDLEKEIEKLKRNMQNASKKPDAASQKLTQELKMLRDNIKSMQSEMDKLHEEVKTVETAKPEGTNKPKEKINYKKTDSAGPWK